MAETPKIDDAEKAYAAAAADVKPVTKAADPVKPVEAPVAAAKPVVAAKVAAPVAQAPAAKPAPAKVAAPKIVKKPAAKKRAVAKAKPAPAPVKAAITRKPTVKPVVAKAPAAPVPTLNQLKEAIMTKTTTDFAKPLADAYGEFQTRAQDAYTKGTAALTEATEFAKGNVEALVESTKIFTAGVQGFGKSYVEEAKTAYETATADVKELAAVKSPTELFQLQGKIARRTFDAMVAASSKNSDAFIKLANDAFAPLTGRVNLAAEKLATVA
jgi:hypothetical protein